MKINSISNKQAFGALMLEKKKITPMQKFIIDNISETVLEHTCNVILFENKFSDIYISPNKDGKSVDIKILSAAGHTYNYIPENEKGELSTNIHFPEYVNNKFSTERMINNINFRVRKFISSSIFSLYDVKEYPVNERKRYNLENVSASDVVSSKLQLEELLPDAVVIYGNPQVTTKDFIKNNKNQ